MFDHFYKLFADLDHGHLFNKDAGRAEAAAGDDRSFEWELNRSAENKE